MTDGFEQLNKLGGARLEFIDQMRALAILSVIAVHTFYSYFPGGGIGVGIFFAVSGFVIGGLLLEEKEFGPAEAFRFILRRIFRIYPAYFTSILLILFLSAISMPERTQLVLQALPGLMTFTRPFNWEPLGIGVGIYWSLEPEFAYYLLAPFFMLVFGQRRGLALLCIALLVSSAISVALDGPLGGGGAHWGGALALGSLVALAWKEGFLERYTIRPDFTTVVSVVGIGILLFIPQISVRIFFVEMMVASLCGCGLIVAFLRKPSLEVFWGAPWIGRISYSLFLTHGIVLDYARPVLGLTKSEKILFFVPIVLGLSVTSYYLIEKPGIKVGKLLISKLFNDRRASV